MVKAVAVLVGKGRFTEDISKLGKIRYLQSTDVLYVYLPRVRYLDLGLERIYRMDSYLEYLMHICLRQYPCLPLLFSL